MAVLYLCPFASTLNRSSHDPVPSLRSALANTRLRLSPNQTRSYSCLPAQHMRRAKERVALCITSHAKESNNSRLLLFLYNPICLLTTLGGPPIQICVEIDRLVRGGDVLCAGVGPRAAHYLFTA